MATTPLRWKEGEGYDIHVLRGGPTSKPLDMADARFCSERYMPRHREAATPPYVVAVRADKMSLGPVT